MHKILVLDLGTTNFKASIFDDAGSLFALERIPTPSTSPTEGHIEMNPEDFRQCICELIQGLGNELAGVTGLTFSTQTNSFLLLDEQDAPLTPIIIWNDTRAKDDAVIEAKLTSIGDLHATTGIPTLSPEFMVAKILWLRQHHPEVTNKMARICLLSDYLTLWFTGQHITEAGAAGLTGLLNIHTLEWWPEALLHFDIDASLLPRVVRAGTDLGPMLSEATQALSLPETCHFVVGCLDQYAGAIGAGNIAPGGLSETTGTVLATVRCTQSPHDNAAVYVGPACKEGIYYQMQFGLTSANLLEYFRSCLSDAPSFSDLDRAASNVPIGAQGLTLPWQSDVKELQDVLLDWSSRYRYDRVTRAILESVAFALNNQVKELCASEFPKEIRCVGGAARSEVWLQIKADIVNCPMTSIACPEPTSLGAALLALSALTNTDIAEWTERCVSTLRTVNPINEHHKAYQQR